MLLRAHAGKPKGAPVTLQRQCTQPYMYLGLGVTVVWVQLMEVLWGGGGGTLHSVTCSEPGQMGWECPDIALK